MTRCPMPLSPSTSAVAARSRTTLICGRTLMPPALMRLTYCGRRKTPCPSAPRASASAIRAATVSASWRGRPTAASASAMNRLRWPTATRRGSLGRCPDVDRVSRTWPPLGSAWAQGVAGREVVDGLARLGEGPRDVLRAVDPQDRHRRDSDVVEAVRLAGRNPGRVVALEACRRAVDLHLAIAFEERYLLGAIVAVHRRGASGRKLRQAGGEAGARGAVPADQKGGHHPIAALELRDFVDLVDPRLGHGRRLRSLRRPVLRTGRERCKPRGCGRPRRRRSVAARSQTAMQARAPTSGRAKERVPAMCWACKILSAPRGGDAVHPGGGGASFGVPHPSEPRRRPPPRAEAIGTKSEDERMQRSTDRILTTHTGSLPRPERLTRLYVQRVRGERVDDGAIAEAGRDAVRAVIPKQAEAGIDVGNNGEQQRESFFLYLKERVTGFGG